MQKKKIIAWVSAFLLILIIAFLFSVYPTFRFFSKTQEAIFNDNLVLIKGGGGNSALLLTDSALVIIDTKIGPAAKKLAAKATQMAGDKPILVINTHYHTDHINGNYLFPGVKKFIGAYDSVFLAGQIKAENQPTIFVKDSLLLKLGNENIELFNMGQGHTFDDLVVYLPDRRMLFTGDLVFNEINPALIRASGCNIHGWTNILDHLMGKWRLFTVVPGHGEPGGPELLVKMKQYFSDMQAAVDDPSREKEMIKKYENWFDIAGMSSPKATINYIKSKQIQ